MHLIDIAGTQNGKYYADLFGNGAWQNYYSIALMGKRRRRKEGVCTAQSGIIQHLVATVIRHSTFTSADIRISPQSLYQKPLILLRRTDERRLKELEPSINLRAFALISECQAGKLALSWSGQKSTTMDQRVLIMSMCLFSKPQISIRMAYSIMSAIFGLASDYHPKSLQERIHNAWPDESPEEHRLSRIIFRRVSAMKSHFRPTGSYDTLVSLFISCQLEAMTQCTESTDILEIAAATADDNVLPFLRTMLNLRCDRDHPLQAYREHMVAQFAARKRLPPPSDGEYWFDSSEDSMDDSEENSIGSGEELLNGDEDSWESDEGSSVSSDDLWQSYQYDSLPEEF